MRNPRSVRTNHTDRLVLSILPKPRIASDSPERDASPAERGTPRLHDQGPNLNTANHNRLNGNGLHQDQGTLSNALPTDDPRLAFIGEMWDRLSEAIKDKLVEAIQEHTNQL